METHAELESQIDQWRAYVQRREAISAADVDEMEDHLRGRVADLRAAGLDDEEAFLVAIKRMGDLDAISREFAREHSDRLWKQLVFVRDDSGDGGTPSWREIGVVLGLAVAAGVAVKVGLEAFDDEFAMLRNVALLVFPFLAGYFAWKRRLTARVLAALAIPFAVLAVVLNAYPFDRGGSTEVLAALHTPVVLWLLAGIAYVGGRWRSDGRRMDFVRFTGELVIYYTLIAIGGGVLVGLTAGVLALVGVDFEPVLESWVAPLAVPGALVVAAWLVEAKQNVIENIAPVLTRIFTPLTIVMLLTLLGALATTGGLGVVDRELLILMDAILVLVLSLLLYSISARDSLRPAGFFDGLQLVMVVAALAVDAVMLGAMVARIAEFGFSPNKVAALGLNVLLLVHLGWAARLLVGFLRSTRRFAGLERWQTGYLPLYGLWAAAVVVVFPPAFGFA